MVLIVFGCRNSITAMEINDSKGCGILKPVFSNNEKVDREDQGKEYKELEKELQKLLDEMKRIEKDVEKNIRKNLLPLLKREIEKLKRWLRELHPEDDSPEPVKTSKRQQRTPTLSETPLDCNI